MGRSSLPVITGASLRAVEPPRGFASPITPTPYDPITLHDGCHDAMVPSRSLRHDAARLARLRCARAVGRPRDEGVLARLHRQPVGAPEGPGQIGAGVIDAHSAPRLTTIGAELDLLNTAVPGEGSTTDDRHPACG